MRLGSNSPILLPSISKKHRSALSFLNATTCWSKESPVAGSLELMLTWGNSNFSILEAAGSCEIALEMADLLSLQCVEKER